MILMIKGPEKRCHDGGLWHAMAMMLTAMPASERRPRQASRTASSQPQPLRLMLRTHMPVPATQHPHPQQQQQANMDSGKR